ncbi:MAG: TlpA family protein disulfide reductase [Flavobacteriales bacterium]|nr:TlpA family protein disulfide reductase [Flavobacteriales bacterium]
MKKLLPIFLLLVGAIVGFYLYNKYRVAPDLSPDTIMVMHPETGNAVPLSDLHEGKLLVNFYASWCGPCMAEMPDLQKGSEYSSELMFVGLTDDPPARIDAVIKKFGITFPIYKVVGKMTDQGVNTYPTTFVFHGNKEVYNKIHARDWGDPTFLDQAIDGDIKD